MKIIKRIIRLVLLLLPYLPVVTQAQFLADYTFATGTDTTKWVEMTGATEILTPEGSSGLVSNVENIGFEFPFGEGVYTHYSVNTDGNLRLGDTVTGPVYSTTPFSQGHANKNNPKINGFGCLGYGVPCRHYVRTKLFGDTLLVVEFSTGTNSLLTSNNQYKWQVHLHSNGNIDIVYPPASLMPADPLYVKHQCGFCVDASDGWIIRHQTSGEYIASFSNGDTATNVAGSWFDAGRYYSFFRPLSYCPRPEYIDAITGVNEMTVFWPREGVETSWEVVLDSITYFTTDTFYTFNNLDANTLYNVSVRSICASAFTSVYRTNAFRTRCYPISSLPYTHDFEGDPCYPAETHADAFPYCWRRVISDTNTGIQTEVEPFYVSDIYPHVISYNNYVIHGGKSLYWYSGMEYNEYAVLPAIDRDSINMNSLFLSFYGVNTTSVVQPPQIIVGVMEGETAVSTFTPVDTVTLTNNPALYVVSMNGYSGTGNYIAFKCPRTMEPCRIALDDVFLNDSWCPIPENVTAMSGSSDVTISWEPNGGTSFSVILGGDTVGGISDTFYSFHNLTTDSEYSYGVATECADSTSFYQTGIVRTQCPFLDSLPYRQGFEDVAVGSYNSIAFVPCFSRLNNGSVYYGYPYVTDISMYCHSGFHGLEWRSGTTMITYGDYQCIVLPGVDTNVYDMNTLQVKFWAKVNSPSTVSFQIGVMTNHNDINSFQLFQTIDMDNHNWVEYVVPLEDFEGYGNRIAIRTLRSDYALDVGVDDITIEVTSNCPEIVRLSADATVGGALLSWDYRDGLDAPTQYEVSYETVEGSNPITIPVTERYVILSGLDAETSYRAYVRAQCGSGDYGLSNSITFNTKEFDCIGVGNATGIDSLDNGTDTSYYVPIDNDYQYSYTQELVLASELGGSAVLTGIDFEYIPDTQMTAKNNVTIYLANVYDTTLVGGFIPYSSEFVEVYSGDLNCHHGWNHFEFDTPFNYYGVSNLLIVFADHSGSYDGISKTFKSHHVSGLVRLLPSLNDYYINTVASHSGSLSPYRSNMRLHRADCTTLSTCAAPAVTVTDIRDTMVEIVWIPGYHEGSWDVAYRELGDVTWITAATGVTTTSYCFTGLNATTNYEFRVQFECNDSNAIVYSTFVRATTQCTPMYIPFYEDFENVTTDTISAHIPLMNCWDYSIDYNAGSSVAPFIYYNVDCASSGRFSLRFYSNSIVMMPPAPVSLDSLQIMFSHYAHNGGSVLEVGVMEDDRFVPLDTITSPVRTNTEHIVTFRNYHGNSRIIAFHNNSHQCIDDIAIDYLQSCPHVRDLTASTQGEEVTLSWIPLGNETHWVVSYDSTSVVVNDNSCTITGLAPSTEYTFIVRSLCSIGDTGEGRSVTIMTHCMSIAVPYFENFDSMAVGSYPPCWLYVMTGPANYQTNNYLPKVVSGSIYSNSGTHSLRLYGEGYFMLPELDVPLDTLRLSFSTFKTSEYDYLDVGVLEGNTFVPIRTIDYPQNSHTNQTVYFTDYTGSSRIIAFRNYGLMSSLLHTSLHYLDDISVDYIEVCYPVENLRCFDVTTNTADIEWDDFLPANRWEVEYGTAGFTPGYGTRTEIYSHPYTISGLDASTEYDVYVRTLCSDMDTGDRVMITIHTSMCDSVVEFYTGDSTGITYYTPINNYFKYTLTETIIDSAEMSGIVDVTSIAYLFSGDAASSTKNNVDIYIQPTDKTVFSDINDAVALDDSMAVRVYHGRLNCSPGWNLIQLDNLYRWDGHSNLMVIIDDNSGNFIVNMAKFSITNCEGAKSLVYYNDVYNPTVQNPSAYAGEKRIFEYRPTMKLLGCGNAVCQSPISDTVGNITYNSATINWTGHSTTYEVAIKPVYEGVWPAGITVTNATSYTFTGLEASTLYQFRVRAECDGLEGVNSGWATGTFTTAGMPCFDPSDITAVASYDAVTVDWTANGTEGMWNIHIWNSGKDTVVTVTAHPATVGGLAQTMTYNVAVKALCNGEFAESEYCDTIEFTTLTCAPVSNVTVSEVTHYGATVTWNGMTQSYDIEYGEHGFGQGQGTKIVDIPGQSYTINWLHANTQYDVYVRAKCDAHNVSDWSPVVSFTTTTGEGITTAEGMSMTIFPNPTSTSATISLGGVSGDVRISIIDLNGRTVMEEPVRCESSCTKQFEVSGLASGAYFVRVSGEGINMVKKLVVK